MSVDLVDTRAHLNRYASRLEEDFCANQVECLLRYLAPRHPPLLHPPSPPPHQHHHHLFQQLFHPQDADLVTPGIELLTSVKVPQNIVQCTEYSRLTI